MAGPASRLARGTVAAVALAALLCAGAAEGAAVRGGLALQQPRALWGEAQGEAKVAHCRVRLRGSC